MTIIGTTIGELFKKDIHRDINGVIKVGQLDDAHVQQELEEYIVTSELAGHFDTLFNHYAASFRNPTDKIGIWISGFFGSGKSHFLKIVSYLLANRVVADRPAVEYFTGKFADPMVHSAVARVAAAGPTTDVILFNIDSVADANSKADKEAIVRVFQKVFDNHLGYLGSVPGIANLERQLDARGELAAFKTAFEEATLTSWHSGREAFDFYRDEAIGAIVSVCRLSEESARRLVDSTIDGATTLSVQDFARRVNAYIDAKGSSQRVVFMIDEVGQYIGENSDLMLNLQTVAEDLGTICAGRAWVFVTSQEAIDQITKQDRMRAQDFSKIQGRFTPRARVNLSSTNTDEVIKLRLLDKRDDLKADLAALYADKDVALRNLIRFTEDAADMPGYRSEASFVAAYPFVPYQFTLLQRSFTAIRSMGSSGKHLASGERSMLDAFQLAAMSVAKHELGALVPFHAFYGAVAGFLDNDVKTVIGQARGNAALEAHDVDLLQTLFLVKYVKELRTNLENLTTLSLTHVDQNRLELRRRVEGSLARLEKQTLVARSGDEYSFLTNEEQDVGREIKTVDVEPGELTDELQKLVFEEVYAEKRVRLDARHQYGVYRKLDDRMYGLQSGELGVHVLTPDADRYAELSDDGAAMLFTGGGTELLVRLPNDDTLGRELRALVQTTKYVLRKNTSTLSPTLRRIIDDRREENREREKRVLDLLRGLIAGSALFANAARVEVKASDPREVVNAGLRKLVENAFNKLGYVKSPFDSLAQVQSALTRLDDSQTLDQDTPNHLAHSELRTFLRNEGLAHRKVTVRNLVDRFTRRPFGWTDLDVLGVLAETLARGEVELRHANAPANLADKNLAANLSAVRKQDEYTLRLAEVVDPAQLRVARDVAKDLLDSAVVPIEAAPLRDKVLEAAAKHTATLKKYLERAATGPYPFKDAMTTAVVSLQGLVDARSPAEFVAKTAKLKDDLEDAMATLEDAGKFFERNIATFDAFVRDLDKLSGDLPHVTDAALLANVDRARAILQEKNPSQALYQNSKILAPVLEHVAELLAERKKAALSAWQAETTHLTEIARDLPQDRRAPITKPLLALKSEIEKATSIDAVLARQGWIAERARGVEGALIDAYNTWLQEQAGPKDTKRDEVESDIKPKTIRKVRVAHLAKKPLLETAEDVEAYLAALRAELLTAINSGDHIRLE
ncbi:BREX system P-loop protein BrxC [Deinococcus yavapaiensis]|uniref:BREX system P-loop protein BrxC n=1 Tax=Deinococcus yavapaiensis KR-236 TaxID=694435 RepID=A0A318S8Q6_9DEIO|nr:BREX system P-loop protein BrxC [Deinococcus yavapaiensis]PYE52022.1 hypothetical protein DES52_11368 [Deinococcus yavapaiensis KR-236]